MISGIKEKSLILTHTMYYVPQRLKTGFVVQGRKWDNLLGYSVKGLLL